MPKTRKTKQRTRRAKTLTIPEVRSALHYVQVAGEQGARAVKYGQKSLESVAKEFASLWSDTFGKRLDFSKAKAYIKHVLNTLPGPKTRRKHKGGALPLAGAPLDYMTRPGLDQPYGNFPEYVSKGFVNPEPAYLQDCGKQTGVVPYPELGSNKVGGGILGDIMSGFSAIAQRPFLAQNPPSIQQDALTYQRGQPMGPGPDASQTAYTYKMHPGMTSLPTAPAITRALGTDTAVRT